MKLSEKKTIAINHIKEIFKNGVLDIDEKGAIIRLEELINAYREAYTLELRYGDMHMSDLLNLHHPAFLRISSALKLLC